MLHVGEVAFLNYKKETEWVYELSLYFLTIYQVNDLYHALLSYLIGIIILNYENNFVRVLKK
jgi:hypothetical protein